MTIEDLTDKVKANWQVEKRVGTWEYEYIFYLYQIKHRGFYTPLKPIIQWIGSDWSNARKDVIQLKDKLKPALIKAFSADSKDRLMLCLPVPKLMNYLDHVNKTSLDHREIFKRESYQMSDVQPGDDWRSEKRPKKVSRKIKDVGFTEFTSFLSLRRQLETIDEVLIMAGVRCFGQLLYDDSYRTVDTSQVVRKQLFLYAHLHYCMKDTCQCLGINKYRDALDRISPEYRTTLDAETSRGVKPMTFVSTDGVQELILKSRRPEVKRLKKYFTSD